VLHDAGYETRTAYDGHIAMQRLSMGYAPDLIILDLVMPRVNGLEVLNWMRQHDFQIPIVLATSEDDVRAADVGAVVKLSKPFTREELLAAVANALRATEQGAEQPPPAGKLNQGSEVSLRSLALALGLRTSCLDASQPATLGRPAQAQTVELGVFWNTYSHNQ